MKPQPRYTIQFQLLFTNRVVGIASALYQNYLFYENEYYTKSYLKNCNKLTTKSIKLICRILLNTTIPRHPRFKFGKKFSKLHIKTDYWFNKQQIEEKLLLLTATWRSFRMAWLCPVPQYAIARVYIPERRKIGSLSDVSWAIRGSASSKRPYIVKAIPTAKPRKIFSCWLSWAYWKIKKNHWLLQIVLFQSKKLINKFSSFVSH